MKSYARTTKMILVLLLSILVIFNFSCTKKEKPSQKTFTSYHKEIVDSLGREITIDKPIEKIIALGNYRCEAIKVLGAADKIIGMDTNSKQGSSYYFPELLDKPDIGTWMQPNVEMIVSLNPDIVITSANEKRLTELEAKLKPTGITVIGLDFYRDDIIKDEIQKLGHLLEKEDEAQDYLEWRERYENQINQYVKGLSEEEKPTVFIEWGTEAGKSYGKGSSGQAVCTFSGGRNVAAELPEFPTVNDEWVVKENPECIVKYVGIGEGKWGWKSTGEPEEIIAEIKARPGWSKISAVKNNKIYLLSTEIAWGLDGIVGVAYWAKWFHPLLNIDPQLMYKEYLERFLKLEYPDPEDIIFAYPSSEK